MQKTFFLITSVTVVCFSFVFTVVNDDDVLSSMAGNYSWLQININDNIMNMGVLAFLYIFFPDGIFSIYSIVATCSVYIYLVLFKLCV